MTLAVFINECTARKELVFFMKKQIQIRNQDNERICDAYLDRKTEQITLVTKEGRHTGVAIFDHSNLSKVKQLRLFVKGNGYQKMSSIHLYSNSNRVYSRCVTQCYRRGQLNRMPGNWV